MNLERVGGWDFIVSRISDTEAQLSTHISFSRLLDYNFLFVCLENGKVSKYPVIRPGSNTGHCGAGRDPSLFHTV